jgi:hypothetical protein
MADGETAATAYTIGWEPQPGPQTALLACPVFEVFFGGARGGGKTDGMLGEWASHADLHGNNAVGLMVRRERMQLLETIERSRQIYGPLGARYKGAGRTERDFALLISRATRTRTLTRGTATRECMSRSWARSRAPRRF